MMFGRQYWHIYAGPAVDGEVWVIAVDGPVDHTVPLTTPPWLGALEWVRSLDHPPTDDEVEALAPARYRDEAPPASTYGIRPHRYPTTAAQEGLLKAAAATPLLGRWP